jgi:hypothetical protein
MASPSESRPRAAPHLEGGVALVAIGAPLLLVSLFLNWYQPGRSAWAVFEVWDLVLAALAVAALLAVAGRLGLARARPDSWLVVPSLAAFVIVVASLLNHPPAAIGEDPMIGIWLALTAAVLMLVGVALSVARVSVAISIHDRADRDRVVRPEPASPDATTGSRGGRFRRSAPVVARPADDDGSSARSPAGTDQTETTRLLSDDPAKPPAASEPGR